jgi:hypothetical protein
MMPRIFSSDESGSWHRRQLANAANLATAAVEVDHLQKVMLYR